MEEAEEGEEMFSEERFPNRDINMDIERTLTSVCVDFARNVKMSKFLKEDQMALIYTLTS